MINNSFDKYVKENIGNSRPDVPAHIWENIVGKKEKIRPIGLWANNIIKIGIAALFILGIAAGVVYVGAYKKAAINESNIETGKLKNKNTTANTTANILPKNVATIATITTQNLQQTKAVFAENQLLKNQESSNQNKKLFHSNATAKMSISGSDPYDEASVTNNNDDYSQLKSGDFLNPVFINKSLFNPGLQKTFLPQKPLIPCPEMEKNAAGSKTYFEVYGGPDYVFNSLTDTANSVYLQKRKASTNYLFAYSVGLRYTKVFGSGMSFRTGINYSQVNEQFKAENGRVSQNVYTINNNGDTTGTYVQTSTKYKVSTNVFRSIDIPVSVGYEMGNGRLHSNVNAGAIINISSSQKGFMLDKNGNTVDISSGKSTSVYQYKSKLGVSFIAAISTYYKLNDHFHLLAEPYIKLALSPATKPDITLKEKFHTAGIRFGVRMDF